ncbi:MAG: SGNH/GDSL hydrolase family protein, partial [Oscillospiraceae bacterium]
PVDKSGCKKYLALGDSITQGMLSPLSSITYPCILEREWDVQLLNHGVGGYLYNANSLDENLEFDPDIITVAYGANDHYCIASVDTIEENVDAYYKKLKRLYENKEIYAITPIWRGDLDSEEAVQKMRQIRKVITRKAQEYGFGIIDGMKLVPHIYEAYTDHGLHPNAFGFEEMAKNIKKSIGEARQS